MKSRVVVLLLAFVAWCAMPAGLPAEPAGAPTSALAAGKGAGAKLWIGAASFRGPVAPSSARLKLHALRGFELTFDLRAALVAPDVGALPALWLPDQRAAIRLGCPRFDRPDSASRAA